MTTLLPILALALAIAAALLAKPPAEVGSIQERGRTAGTIWVVATGVIAFLLAYVWRGWNSDATHLGTGILAGALGAALCRWTPVASRRLCALALAGACAGGLLWIPAEWQIQAQLGAVAGAALGAWLLDVRSPSTYSLGWFPVVLASVISADILGTKAQIGENFGFTGTLLAVSGAAAGVLAMLASLRGARLAIQQLIAIILLAIGLFVIGSRYFGLRDAWILALAGVIIGVVANWLLDEDAVNDALRPLIAAVMWIGLATIGFALRRGFGMSLGLLGGVSALVLLGNARALLTLGPLAGLVMYRVFREVNVGATHALDIGQHYALIGLAIGALVPLMPAEWLRARAALMGPRLPSSGLLWLLLLAAVPIGIALLMGPKGVVGFVVGLGFAGLLECIRGSSVLQPLSLGLGVAGSSAVAFQMLGENATMSRADKTAVLIPLAIGLAVLVVLLVLISPRPQFQEAEVS